MTPDTFGYMLAGFLVIFLGIIGYIFSLIYRNAQVKTQIEKIASNKEKEV